MDFNQSIKSVAIKPRKARILVRQFKHVPILELREKILLSDKIVLSSVIKKGIDAAIDRIKSSTQDPKDFKVKRITVGEGLKLKRRKVGSRGRAYPFTHARSNISILVGAVEKNSLNKPDSVDENKKEETGK